MLNGECIERGYEVGCVLGVIWGEGGFERGMVMR